MPPIALTIAGSDPGGGAGIQADLKTFHQLGVYGASAITLVTVQNTVRVSRVELLVASLVAEQIDAVLEDLPPSAIKTGALGSAEIVEAVASRAFKGPLVVDPVTISKHGYPLLNSAARDAMRTLLLPRAALVTPNLDEAAQLTGIAVDCPESMKEAARRIADLGPRAVLVKGGHLEGDALDILFAGGQFTDFRSPRIETRQHPRNRLHLFSRDRRVPGDGRGLEEAVGAAKAFITEAIRTAPGLGGGAGPLNHWVSL